MANMKCKACGRRYSYHESDLCPHCGAYNRPSSRMRVDFDKDGNAELLHEQEFQRKSAAKRQQKDCYEHETMHESGERTARRGGGGLTIGKLAVLIIGLAIFIGSLFLIDTIWYRTPENNWSSDVPIPDEEPAQEITDDYVFYYAPGEQFVFDEQPVWVDSVSIDGERLWATVHWEEEPIYTPELYVRYEDGSELFSYTWHEDNAGDGSWQYDYTDDGFGWANVTEAYLSFYGYAVQDEMYYEARVDITDVFQSAY